MPIIRIRNQSVDVDVRAEIERYSWDKAKWTEDKLIAASPFRYDRSPSFFVRIESYGDVPAGVWSDSGAYDQEWASGNFCKLLAFLRDETYEETEEYLIAEYGREWEYGERIEIPKLSLKVKQDRHLPIDALTPYKWRHPYLERRGISEVAQRMMRIGYDRESQAVTIPWFSADGRLANIKYRKTQGKVFWYEKGAVPIRNLIYGMDVIYRKKLDEVVLCEAEIDALSWMSVGVNAISVGGANFTEIQADIIRKSPIKKLIICSDNDKAGRKMRNQVIGKLVSYMELSEIILPSRYKDANEAIREVDITSFYRKSVPIRQMNI